MSATDNNNQLTLRSPSTKAEWSFVLPATTNNIICIHVVDPENEIDMWVQVFFPDALKAYAKMSAKGWLPISHPRNCGR